ncbi:MAG: hypothetical protein ACTSRE_12495 [Promethearchaeota archaeon]
MVDAPQVINDVSGSIILFFGLIMGIILIFRYKESRAKIVLYFGITCIFVGLIYLVFFLRIITYFVPLPILYAKIPPFNSYPLLCLTTYARIGPAVLAATYVGTESLIPRQYRKLFHMPGWILVAGWEVSIFFFKNSWLNDFTLSEIIGDTSFQLISPPFFLMMFFALFLLCFLCLGFLIRAFKTGGMIESKFILVSIGLFQMILELIFGGIEAIGESIAFVITLRSLMLIGLLLLNYGLTPSKKKIDNLKLPREVANLAYYVIGDELDQMDEQFWDHYIAKSKEFIEDYKEKKKIKQEGQGE